MTDKPSPSGTPQTGTTERSYPPPHHSHSHPGPQVVSQSTCLALLRSVEIGRLAVIHEGKPLIFPINFVLDHGAVVFRAPSNSTLARTALNGPVSFEADAMTSSETSIVPSDDEQAWSVLITGTVVAMSQVSKLLHTALLPVHCWHSSAPAREEQFLRLRPTHISGRRFSIQRPPTLGASVLRAAPH